MEGIIPVFCTLGLIMSAFIFGRRIDEDNKFKLGDGVLIVIGAYSLIGLMLSLQHIAVSKQTERANELKILDSNMKYVLYGEEIKK